MVAWRLYTGIGTGMMVVSALELTCPDKAFKAQATSHESKLSLQKLMVNSGHVTRQSPKLP